MAHFNQRNPRASYLTLLVLAAACVLSITVAAHPGSGIAVDRVGQVYFLDTGSGLWRIGNDGNVTQLSTTRFHWLAIDEGNYFASSALMTGALGEIQTVGSNPAVLLASDWPIAIGTDGNLYYQSGPRENLKIVRRTPSGSTSVIATLPSTATGKPLEHLNGIIAGPGGSLYYTEETAIRRINARGRITTVARVRAPSKPPSIPATDQHPYLRGLAVDSNGVMYVADTGDARVLKITPSGRVTTLLQTQSPWAPTAVALFGSDLYVLEFLHTVNDVRREWLPRVRKLGSDGTDTIIATIDKMPGAR